MATAAMAINRAKPVRRRKPELRVIHGSKELGRDEGRELLVSLTERMDARRLQRRLERIGKRYVHSPERRSVAVAMLAVEEQIVKALWTIARQPLGKVMPLPANRNGLEYMHDRGDVHSIYTDAAGGKWDSVQPRPAIPSAKDISAADRVQQWLLLLDEERLRRILVIGATSKRGDAGRQVNWNRVKASIPEVRSETVYRLSYSYSEALRVITSRLTLKHLER